MALPEFDESTIRSLASKHSYNRGEEYYQAGGVNDLVLKDDIYYASVRSQDKRTHPYFVKIWGRGNRIESSCTCPRFGGGICRHCVAAMLTVLKGLEGHTAFKWCGLSQKDAPSAEPAKPALKSPVDPDNEVVLMRRAAEKACQQAELLPDEGPRTVRAHQIMTSSVVSLAPEASLDQAWELIRERRFRHVLILSKEKKLMGIISDRDLLGEAATIGEVSPNSGGPLKTRKTVQDLMKTRVLTTGPDADIRQIARVMFEERIGSMPVLGEGDTPVGIITRSDILWTLLHHPLFEFLDDRPVDVRPVVLCVDDEIVMLEMLRQQLEDEPYEVVVASNGQEALAHMEAKKISVVVSDHRMPGMLGSEFLARVRERWPNAFRIMLTGYPDFDTMNLAVTDGKIHRFLSKPWDSDELKLIVRKGIADSKATETA